MLEEANEVSLEFGDLEVDALLRWLVYLADVDGLSVGLTVHAGGTLVSGTLVSRSEYQRLLVDEVRSSGADGEAVKALTGVLADHRGAASNVSAIAHLHMKDAVIADSSGDGLYRRFLWRGRLRAVDGWTFGAAQSVRRR